MGQSLTFDLLPSEIPGTPVSKHSDVHYDGSAGPIHYIWTSGSAEWQIFVDCCGRNDGDLLLSFERVPVICASTHVASEMFWSTQSSPLRWYSREARVMAAQ